MRTNKAEPEHTARPIESLKEQTWTWWIEQNAKHFFKRFKWFVKRDARYDAKWEMYFQNYGLFFKAIQSVVSEIDKTDNISKITLDKALKKKIKKYNKIIKKNGKNK